VELLAKNLKGSLAGASGIENANTTYPAAMFEEGPGDQLVNRA